MDLWWIIMLRSFSWRLKNDFYFFAANLSFHLYAMPTWEFLFQEHTTLTVHACTMKVMRLDLNCMVFSRTWPAAITSHVLSHKKYKLVMVHFF